MTAKRYPRVDGVPPSHPNDVLLIDVSEGISHAAEMELGNKVRHGGTGLPADSWKTPAHAKMRWKSPAAEAFQELTAPWPSSALVPRGVQACCLPSRYRQTSPLMVQEASFSPRSQFPMTTVFLHRDIASAAKRWMFVSAEISQELDLQPADGNGWGAHGVQSTYKAFTFPCPFAHF